MAWAAPQKCGWWVKEAPSCRGLSPLTCGVHVSAGELVPDVNLVGVEMDTRPRGSQLGKLVGCVQGARGMRP